MKKIKNKQVAHFSGVEMTVLPHYNAYQGGYGIHKSAKYPDRSSRKRETRKMISEYQEGSSYGK